MTSMALSMRIVVCPIGARQHEHAVARLGRVDRGLDAVERSPAAERPDDPVGCVALGCEDQDQPQRRRSRRSSWRASGPRAYHGSGGSAAPPARVTE